MTRSSSGPGRQPGRPFKDEDKRRSSFAPDSSPPGADNQGTDGAEADSGQFKRGESLRRRPARRTGLETENGGAEVQFVQIGIVKRGIALMIDVVTAFLFSLIVLAVIGIVNWLVPVPKILTQNVVIMACMLCRDTFFQGRGIGKNLMGLQVVDASTGQRPSLLQSVKRNVLFFVPLLCMGLSEVTRFVPLGSVGPFIYHAIQFFCTIYVIVFLPAELYLALKTPDSRRLGDKLANTRLVESSMDFSKLI